MRIPTEIACSVLAATTAFIGGNALGRPAWAIFVGWAATHLAGGSRRSTYVVLYPAMIAGAAFGLVVVLLDTVLGTALGSGQTARDVALAVIILVVNTALMYAGRTRLLIPGMFLGFASYFATALGGFGFVPNQPPGRVGVGRGDARARSVVRDRRRRRVGAASHGRARRAGTRGRERRPTVTVTSAPPGALVTITDPGPPPRRPGRTGP